MLSVSVVAVQFLKNRGRILCSLYSFFLKFLAAPFFVFWNLKFDEVFLFHYTYLYWIKLHFWKPYRVYFFSLEVLCVGKNQYTLSYKFLRPLLLGFWKKYRNQIRIEFQHYFNKFHFWIFKNPFIFFKNRTFWGSSSYKSDDWLNCIITLEKNTFTSMYLSVSMCCVYCIPCQENTYGTWLDENEDSFVHFVALRGFYMIVFITAFEFVNFPLIILNCDLSPFERYFYYFLKKYPLITSPKRKKLKKFSLEILFCSDKIDQSFIFSQSFFFWSQINQILGLRTNWKPVFLRL